MKIKKILFVILVVMVCCLTFYHVYQEHFQHPIKNNSPDVLKIIEKFCNKQYQDHWNIDSLFSYNENIVFVVIQTKEQKIDLSIQPDNRAIIIENIQGETENDKKDFQRVFRF